MNDIITVDMLIKALEALFHEGKEGQDEWIKQMAIFIMDFFGYEQRVLDNNLTPKDRDIFYMLENSGILRTEMDETTIQKGKTWRIHYWVLNRDRIRELSVSKQDDTELRCNGENGMVYDHLSEGVWSRNDQN
ncbi:MAG: hypothetical protein QCI82_02655 [Candidatus Thermoplasmatota archaeon]|nr:hypothetical protein [Candidatus Thermoplasmatota archaeon]